MRFEEVKRMEACYHLAENNSEHPQRVLGVLVVILLPVALLHKLFQHLKRVVEEVRNAVFEFGYFCVLLICRNRYLFGVFEFDDV